jgi:two-component system, chemotaxis family, chemotaxis protein CheY
MSPNAKEMKLLVCDENQHIRRLVADVLASQGFLCVNFANDGADLLRRTSELHPRIIVTSSRLPEISGLEVTRTIRGGYKTVPRETSIIIMTETPTKSFIEAAREAGADELLARPFTGHALLARVEAVLVRPRRFVELGNYVGPCRRRRMLEDYGGARRRLDDMLEVSEKLPWEVEANRELAREGVARISDLLAAGLPGEGGSLPQFEAAVSDAEQLADEVNDRDMGDSARSLGRYLAAVGPTGAIDRDVVTTHIDALQKLCALGAEHAEVRSQLVRGLVKIVEKRLGRKIAAAAVA